MYDVYLMADLTVQLNGRCNYKLMAINFGSLIESLPTT